MVSQPALVSDTLVEKPADVTVVEKMSADTPKQEGRTQKVTAKEGGCSQRAVAKHITGLDPGKIGSGAEARWKQA